MNNSVFASRWLLLAPTLGAGMTLYAQAAAPARCTVLSGTVRDTTEALIPGAALTLDGQSATTSGADGLFRFPCVTPGRHTLLVASDGFAAKKIDVSAPHAAALSVILSLEQVETQLDVDVSATAATSANASGPTQTIAGDRLQALADDPDDLQRELTQLAAAAGGNPSNTTIAVDGFQDSSALPPKSSIAYIVVNPDQFSAQYREPPFEGGRVEVYTKPGAKTFHGALFAVNGSPWMNARDPFSVSKASIGKQRYGFELSGPVTQKNSDFAVTLEHRSIDNFAVVNAVTLDGSGNQTSTIANVATPQRLWLATARYDLQLGAKNTFIATYSANVNHLSNQGVGGSTLQEGAYDAQTYEHMFRISDVTLFNAHLMHEARASFRWSGSVDAPVSNAPQVGVAGAFTGGGSTLGPQHIREFQIEYDDDAILTTKAHTLKFGTQFFNYLERRQLTQSFNGSYVFGGGTAPVLDANNNAIAGQTETITGVEQYRRALLGYAGGQPTAYSVVTGTPTVNFNQVRDTLFFQDDWNAGHGLHVAYGVRYYIQNDPLFVGSLVPRIGLLWSPDKKGRWTLHAHWGMFSGQEGTTSEAEMLREDGVHRITSTVYSPTCTGVFVANTCQPLSTGTVITSQREWGPHLGAQTWGATNVGGTRVLPYGFNLSIDYYAVRMWDMMRSKNINAPLNGSPTGPRPGPANTNIYRAENSAQGTGNAVFGGLENHKFKRVQFFVGGVRVNLIDDNNDDTFFTPQNANSDAGEFARRLNQGEWNVFGNATVTLPEKIQVSFNYSGQGGHVFNVTTGFDNNGDGVFNDRPTYAVAGTPLCSVNPNATPCGYATKWGELVASGGTGVFPRDKGVMPWSNYLDTNLQRTFKLSHNAKADHPQSVTLNVRSSNVLNHMNVTSVGGVLGSPQFGVAYAADPGRRIEAGVRYSF
ncbi:Carboxypeptidase regulatory-like domain-containing protein [Bryocella elongata]|uniref:Carboxypeptidase regulatory-like domain-containing protein n=1 Tax=Bryocella elongata TaxID=863522 RepID=A0A1H5XZN0_9BACT|nr:carboxypeptidase-like regulatory domain-containing protein [Bryocella elongata]SEG17128.1 Carboxypeptidase regulatory-like domain-containing protein [Bryocella elongata]